MGRTPKPKTDDATDAVKAALASPMTPGSLGRKPACPAWAARRSEEGAHPSASCEIPAEIELIGLRSVALVDD